MARVAEGAGAEGVAVRAAAARAVAGVLGGASLDGLVAAEAGQLEDRRDRALLREIATGSIRWCLRLQAALERLLDRPARDRQVRAVLIVGLYQLACLRVPPHAAVAATVEAARVNGKPRAAGLVNAVLRRFQREGDAVLAAVDARNEGRYACPAWLIRRLRQDWPRHWREVLEAGNAAPPMWLRVNRRRTAVAAYAARLLDEVGVAATPCPDAPHALLLERPVETAQLPGFDDGLVSVQDGAAQLAAPLLDLQPGQRVLDACAAPGGKSAHLLELADVNLTALDSDAQRLERLRANLRRLGLEARVCLADASEPGRWWDGRLFDRILLDVPCSATGVVRRHPDIKLLRRPGDVATLARRQRIMLAAAWPLLAPGGRLLYVTCSVLREENADTVEAFLTARNEALAPWSEVSTAPPFGHPSGPGLQLLPGEAGMDGFYYSVLDKRGA